jgi:hypothetical protein
VLLMDLPEIASGDPAFGHLYGSVVNTGNALAHQALVVEFPKFDAFHKS